MVGLYKPGANLLMDARWVWGRSPMFVDQGFEVAVKSPDLWRQAPSPHLCLAGISQLLLLDIFTPNISVL